MRLSKTAYYGDFAIYAGVVITATAVAAWHDTRGEKLQWLVAALIGAIAWTLLEYLLHRFVLHRVRFFAAMHDAHHLAPRALVGTPTWLSLGVLGAVVFLPAWVLGSLNSASGLLAGVMAGFFWYGLAHHAIHHRQPRLLASRLRVAARRHGRHHAARAAGNYGVTTVFWDYLFRTSLEASAPPRSTAAGRLRSADRNVT
jgi:sterol desaturase/sphingolipid hydroxylase (fatty acid hydroxylase superfamily)